MGGANMLYMHKGRILLNLILAKQKNFKLVRPGMIFTTLFLITLNSFGQNKKDLTISLSGGLLNSPYYENANAKGFYGFDFDYHFAKKHLLSVNYFSGKHTYYDDVLSNNPTGSSSPDGTNADAEYLTFSVLYKYKILDNTLLSLVPGVGAGIMTHTREYPYQEVNTAYPRISSWSDLVFPISLELNFKLSNQWQAGLTGGFLIHPDYPILALHAGPKLSYIFK